jgi:hypothetical protein
MPIIPSDIAPWHRQKLGTVDQIPPLSMSKNSENGLGKYGGTVGLNRKTVKL